MVQKSHSQPPGMYTKFNIAPEKWWLEDDPFLLGPGNFSGENSLLNFGRVNPVVNNGLSTTYLNYLPQIMGKSHSQPPGMYKIPINNGISTVPTSTGDLNPHLPLTKFHQRSARLLLALRVAPCAVRSFWENLPRHLRGWLKNAGVDFCRETRSFRFKHIEIDTKHDVSCVFFCLSYIYIYFLIKYGLVVYLC